MKVFRLHLESNCKKLVIMIGQLSMVAFSLWAIAFVLTYNPLYALLYKKAWSTPGHQLMSQISRDYASDMKTCYLVGLSSLANAIEPDVFSAEYPEYKLINITSGGGTVFKVDMFVNIMAEYFVKPDCIILGLQPSLLRDRRLQLKNHGYLDVMGLLSQKRFIHREEPEERYITLIWAEKYFMWPGLRPSLQLNRIMRVLMYEGQRFKKEQNQLSMKSFQLFDNELASSINLLAEKRFDSDMMDKFYSEVEKQGDLNPEKYARQKHIESLERLLNKSLAITDKVVVIVLPEARWARENMSKHAKEQFWHVLNSYDSNRGLTILDKSARFPDNAFDAVFHLLPDYRKTFSKEICFELSAILNE